MRTPKSETKARKALRRVLQPGWYDAQIVRAVEKLSSTGGLIELAAVVRAIDGSERTLRDWLTTQGREALKTRSCCLAVGSLPAYEAGEISAELFPVHHVRVKIGIRKQRGWLDQNFISDYAAPGAAAVQLRSVS